MKDCIVTQLEGNLGNDLPVLGEIRITVKPISAGETSSINSSTSSAFIFVNPTSMELVGNAHFKRGSTNLGKTVDLPAYDATNPNRYVTIYYEDTEDVTLIIKDLYNISTKINDTDTGGFSGISGGGTKIKSITGFPSLKYAAEISALDLNGIDYDVTLEDLMISEDLAYVNFYNTDKVIGDISLFGKFNKLNSIQCGSSLGLYGTIESMVEARVASGFTDGASISVRLNGNTKITLNKSNTVPYAGLMTITRNGNAVTIVQSSATKATYNILTGEWTY